MKVLNEIILIILGKASVFTSLNVEQQQPYWYLISKGMTKSSTTVVLIVLLVLMIILLSLVIWDRISRSDTQKKIKIINWQKFNSFVKESALNDYNTKLLKEIILRCDIDIPDRIYKEISFFEYKLNDFVNQKIDQNKISKVLIKNSEVSKFNDKLTESIRDIKEAFDFFHRGQNLPDISSRQLRLSSKVFIRVDKYAKSIETKVRNNTVLFFSVESNSNLINYLSAGEVIDLFYERDGQYRMKLKVLDINEFEIKLLHTIDMKRTQKRDFVRYETKLGIRFKFITRTTKSLTNDIFVGNIVDISGGGIKFNSREKISKDDNIIAFGMWNEMELKFKAKILRVDEIETSSGIVYVGYCLFIGMDKQFVDKIVKKIFSEISKDLNKNLQ